MPRLAFMAAVVAAIAVVLYALNNSWPANPRDEFAILAHRGVHQTYPGEGLSRDTCTAGRIHPPAHEYLENTIPSIRRAFELGADAVEIDIHPTADGEFAVFHDWTLDCRTNGTGVTRERTMAYIRTLDAGHGYTADGGKSFPLRGRGVAMIPTLSEVLGAFPGRRFQINIKSNDRREAEFLDAYLRRHGFHTERLTFFGGPRPIERLRQLRPKVVAASRARVKACLKSYLLTGWTGRTPPSCRNTLVFVPVSWGPLLWGWPDRFVQRMQEAGSRVWLGGAVKRGVGSLGGVDDLETVKRVPGAWKAGVFTDRIEVVGPALKARARRERE